MSLRVIFNKLRIHTLKTTKLVAANTKRVKHILFVGIFPIILAAGSDEANIASKVENQEASFLTNKYLVRNAASTTVDAVCCLINQTIAALINAETEYATAMYTLIKLLDYKSGIKGCEEEEEMLWDLIIQQKSEVRDCKEKRQHLDQVMNSVEKLASSTAETAFATGNDSLAIMLNEHMQSGLLQLSTQKKVTSDAEQHLLDAMAKDIENEKLDDDNDDNILKS